MKRPAYLVITAAAIIIMLLTVLTLRRYLPHGIALAPKRPPAIVISMNNAYFVGIGRDGKQWSTKARRVEIGQDRSLTRLADIYDGKVFDKDKVVLKVKAGRAAYRSYNRNLQLAGGVEVIGPQGQKITSPGADWNSSTQVLRSNGRVDVITKSSTVSSERLEVNVRDRNLSMWNVQGRIKMNDIPTDLQEGLNNAH